MISIEDGTLIVRALIEDSARRGAFQLRWQNHGDRQPRTLERWRRAWMRTGRDARFEITDGRNGSGTSALRMVLDRSAFNVPASHADLLTLLCVIDVQRVEVEALLDSMIRDLEAA